MSDAQASAISAAQPSLDLYWIPLGAGTPVVRASGRVYEAFCALSQHRQRCDLYHAALVAIAPDGLSTVEVAPVPDDRGPEVRGVVGEGPVGMRWAGRFRIFRYEIRRWRGGEIPDVEFAVASPVRIADGHAAGRSVLDLLEFVPRPVWGRDELEAGEMWNSNSVVAWALTQAGLVARAGRPPDRGRAPGWDAGVTVARRLPVSERERQATAPLAQPT